VVHVAIIAYKVEAINSFIQIKGLGNFLGFFKSELIVGQVEVHYPGVFD